MNNTALSLAILIYSAGLGLYGGLVANYIWWLIDNLPIDTKRKFIKTIFGVIFTIAFIYLLFKLYILYLLSMQITGVPQVVYYALN